jgi:hypothetical protein
VHRVGTSVLMTGFALHFSNPFIGRNELMT